jgi:hypothetical protein
MDDSKPKDNVVELRRHPRFRMSTPVILSFSRSEVAVSFRGDHQGDGTVADLSTKGCRILSPASVRIGDRLRLSLRVPRDNSPLTIDHAYVRWVEEGSFGLEWKQLPPDVERKLKRLIESQS